MSQLDALSLTETIQRRLVEHSLYEHFTRRQDLRDICRTIWGGSAADGGLVSDIWVEGAFGSKPSAETLRSLTHQGVVHQDLPGLLDQFPADRPLYEHQAQALIQASQGQPRPGIVVTAGTGAGKTESFLLPILNDLVTHPRTSPLGMRCLILYPMNALVNDQVQRVYELLQEQERVSLFHFTSETPEDERSASRRGLAKYKPCRRNTRAEARANPPDIVITNFSMLEYMLCRPQDAPFFGPGLRSIVLDEAHLYTGTLAAEMTLLLRRLLLRCGLRSEDVLHMATSATLSTDTLDTFASTVFSKPKALISVIEGQAHRQPLPSPSPPARPPEPEAIAALSSPTTLQMHGDRLHLVSDPTLSTRLHQQLQALATDTQKAAPEPARVLHRVLSQAPKVHELETILWNKKRLALPALAQDLWGQVTPATEQATIRLLQMSASARLEASDRPLVAHRIHVLTRASDGLNVCLNEACPAPSHQKLAPLGAVQAGGSITCRWCQAMTLSLYRCPGCGQELVAATREQMTLGPVIREESPYVLYSTVKPGIGASTEHVIAPVTGEVCGAGAPGLTLHTVENCPGCDQALTPGQGEFQSPQSFRVRNQLALSIVVESALAEVPPYPSKGADWLPGRGRRLLAFSDSRAAAARLGTRLLYQHEKMLLRAALVEVIKNNPVDPQTIEVTKAEIARFESELANPGLTPALRTRLEQKLRSEREALKALQSGGDLVWWTEQLQKSPTLRELLHAESAQKHQASTWSQKTWEDNAREIVDELETRVKIEFAIPGLKYSLQASGLVDVVYPGLDPLLPPAGLLGRLPHDKARERLASCWPQVLALLCDTLRQAGAVTLGSDAEDASWHTEGIPIARWSAAHVSDGQLIRFVGSTERQSRRLFAAQVLQACGAPTTLAPDLLEAAFDQLRTSGLGFIETSRRDSSKGPVEAIRIRMPDLAARVPLTLFQCPTTLQVVTREALGCAPGLKPPLHPVTAEELDKDPRQGRIRTEIQAGGNALSNALWAEEHSAQLSPQENRRLQDLFKAGMRNVLSATTTLELGIDIGGLNAVFLSNVPPGLANYLQRAGRAGRRADGSSVVITFVRPRPYDREVFLHFGKYLGRALRRPLAMLERSRVVRRHVHALLLGDFFRRIYPPGTKVGAMNAFGNVGSFVGVPLPRYWDGGPKPKLDELTPDWVIPPHEPWSTPKKTTLADYFLAFVRWAQGDATLQAWTQQVVQDTTLAQEPWETTVRTLVKQFKDAVGEWSDEYEVLLQTWRGVEPGQSSPAPRPMANSLRYQLQALHETTVIETFSDKQFLPRYGFPIGLQKLRIIKPDENKPHRVREEDQYRLERAGLMALREYVPGSQMLVGGKILTSRGVLKHWTGASVDSTFGLRGQYAECKNQHFFYTIAGPLGDCPVCREPAKGGNKDLLLVRHGFSSAAWDLPRRGHETERVGTTERATIAFTSGHNLQKFDDFADVRGLTLKYREDGELLVINAGDSDKGFALCLKCGYADSENGVAQGALKLPSGFGQHAPLQSNSRKAFCWKAGEAPVLRNRSLAARETTDILLMDFSRCLGSLVYDEALMQALGVALQIAAAKVLELDVREIGLMVGRIGVLNGFSLVLYDNVPGGAGHVYELVALERTWLHEARQALFVNAEHDARCTRACLDCLLSYDLLSDQVVPDRLKALAALGQLGVTPLDGTASRGVVMGPNGDANATRRALESTARQASSQESTASSKNVVPSPTAGLSVEERLARARARQKTR